MEAKTKFRLLLKNIKQLVCISDKKLLFKRMLDCTDICVRYNQTIVVNSQGIITKIGESKQLEQYCSKLEFAQIIDCSGLCVIPGLIDAHTHSVFYGDRSKEYQMKLNGKGYVQIYNEGLGIRYTTQQVAKSTINQLFQHLEKYLKRMSKLGTTSLEIKSGYGLDAENQIKMLKAIELAKAKYKNKITIVSTFCGAHAIPKGKTQLEQTKDVIENQIPAIKKAMENNEINPTFIDVFCEKNFFEIQSSTQILLQGKKIGLLPSFHGDELNNLESGSIAKNVGAKAVSHIEYLSDVSIQKMSQNDIVGVLLPTTQNIEKLPIPPITKMRNSNMIVALGSDFCPNAFCYNMGLTAHYACTNYRLTPTQSIVSATLNSAYSLGLQNQRGSIQQGKFCDVLLLDVDNWVYFLYAFGDSYIEKVIKEGVVL